MSPISATAPIERVKAWLLDYKPKLRESVLAGEQDLDMDLDLIENRIIDSLGFMDFVFFLEELAGRQLLEEAQSANAFRTLRIIQEKILQG